MFKYVKHLSYPVSVTKKDLKMAKLIITQVGGYAGELGASLRYFHQKFTMPDELGRALLNDIATEEIGHLEMVATIVSQLISNATIDEIKEAGLESFYTEHGKGVFPMNADGVAAEQKARVAYEHLIDLATDPKVIEPLLFLRQREIVHFNRFQELYNYYKDKGYK